ncbi:MAG: glycine cleavage T C-terminal barrel domain-containing protein [Tepidisphaeraceae bacterium]|jgi:aminomethyltransferase
MASQSSNPLLEVHRRAEAEFQPYGDVEIVSTFGQPQAEYAAIRKGCALLDLPQRGILEITGKDRLDFLNRLLTNQIVDKQSKQSLSAGGGVYAFLLSNKGRIVSDMNVLERGDRTLLETDARNVPALQAELEKYIFSEQVKLASQMGRLHQLALHGPKSAEILRQLLPQGSALPPVSGSVAARFLESEVILWRDDPTGAAGYGLIMPVEAANRIWTEITSRFGPPPPAAEPSYKRQVWPAGWAAFNTTRIEAGRPLFGIDFDQTVLPAETGQLQRAVSFTKGCYVGQEIVARMHARGQIARHIVGVRMHGDALPIAAAPVFDSQKNQVGQITSSTLSPSLSNSAICLAMVKGAFASAGTELLIAAEGAISGGSVVDLPFLKTGMATNESA